MRMPERLTTPFWKVTCSGLSGKRSMPPVRTVQLVSVGMMRVASAPDRSRAPLNISAPGRRRNRTGTSHEMDRKPGRLEPRRQLRAPPIGLRERTGSRLRRWRLRPARAPTGEEPVASGEEEEAECGEEQDLDLGHAPADGGVPKG